MNDYVASMVVKQLKASSSSTYESGFIMVLKAVTPEMVFEGEHNPKIRFKASELLKEKSLSAEDFQIGERFYTVKLKNCLYLLVCKVEDFNVA